MANKQCSHCDRGIVYAKDLCVACYHYQRRHGNLPKIKEKQHRCNYCQKESTNFKKGLCQTCYRYSLRHGTPERQPKTLRGFVPCEHCHIGDVIAVGLCASCYQSLRKTGKLPKLSQRKRDTRQCKLCQSVGVYAKGLCKNCYNRQLRNKK